MNMSLPLFPGPETTFTSRMTTEVACTKVSVEQFQASWRGGSEALMAAVEAARVTMVEKGRYRTPSINHVGTTLRDIRHLLSDRYWSELQVVVAMNYYGLLECRP